MASRPTQPLSGYSTQARISLLVANLINNGRLRLWFATAMNINYVRADRLPDFENYDEILDPLHRNEFFVTTGEVLIPSIEIGTDDPNTLRIDAELQWTLPLARAEITWGAGEAVHHEVIELDQTRAHGSGRFEWRIPAPSWEWARVAVWDVAASGAFVNPVWRRE